MNTTTCYHCGDSCKTEDYKVEDKNFCCMGCKTVFEIFSENNLTCYYDLQDNPGAIPEEIKGKFDFLESQEIVEKLLDFNDNNPKSSPDQSISI